MITLETSGTYKRSNNMKINLEELYRLQEDLDVEIAKNHNVSYESTHSKRLLALIVEIGELANETRCFKFWSNKGPSPKERIMDEYADGLHFLLSLGIPLHAKKLEYEMKKSNEELTLQIHQVYKSCIALLDNYDLVHYETAFQNYLNLALSIDMDANDVIASYKNKLEVNHVRQQQNY